MKLPKAVLTLTLVFAASLSFTAVFLVYAIRRRNIGDAFLCALSALTSGGILYVIEDYCRAASFRPREYISMTRVITDFFQSDALTNESIHD